MYYISRASNRQRRKQEVFRVFPPCLPGTCLTESFQSETCGRRRTMKQSSYLPQASEEKTLHFAFTALFLSSNYPLKSPLKITLKAVTFLLQMQFITSSTCGNLRAEQAPLCYSSKGLQRWGFV